MKCYEFSEADVKDLLALVSSPALGINASQAGRVYQLQVLLSQAQPIECVSKMEFAIVHDALHANVQRADAAESKLDRCTDALNEIAQWSDAYPLSVFPEPDFKRAAEVLQAAGMTLDAISASNMRHVVTRVGEIAKGALK